MGRDLNWILCSAWKKWIGGTPLEHPPCGQVISVGLCTPLPLALAYLPSSLRPLPLLWLLSANTQYGGKWSRRAPCS
jgi:hypothetical protein